MAGRRPIVSSLDMDIEPSSSPLGGRVALVTGAGSGIGAATARKLAKAGAHVIALDLSLEKAGKIRDLIVEQGGTALALAADVAKADAMTAALAHVHQAVHRLDIVVANAGINGLWAPLEDIAPEDWDRTMAVNLRGTFLTIKSSLALLKISGGAIVVVASVNGTRIFSNSGASAYATSKAAQRAFARMIALELAPHRIRVNTVCPGSIDTNIDASTERRNLEQVKQPVAFPEGRVPLTGGRPGSPDDVAALIHFLVSDAAAHITGTEVFVDGGESLLQG
jgi:NAD(P)-dependent dehydrogenase (short-subunit alcohol dehydrogenase family)